MEGLILKWHALSPDPGPALGLGEDGSRDPEQDGTRQLVALQRAGKGSAWLYQCCHLDIRIISTVKNTQHLIYRLHQV